jgi:hypothetical protein
VHDHGDANPTPPLVPVSSRDGGGANDCGERSCLGPLRFVCSLDCAYAKDGRHPAPPRTMVRHLSAIPYKRGYLVRASLWFGSTVRKNFEKVTARARGPAT